MTFSEHDFFWSIKQKMYGCEFMEGGGIPRELQFGSLDEDPPHPSIHIIFDGFLPNQREFSYSNHWFVLKSAEQLFPSVSKVFIFLNFSIWIMVILSLNLNSSLE